MYVVVVCFMEMVSAAVEEGDRTNGVHSFFLFYRRTRPGVPLQ